MKAPQYNAAVGIVMILVVAPGAWSAPPAPPFDVAYRAWEVVTELARHNGAPQASGECGRTFQPFVVPALRRQTRQEQDRAAVACVEAARSACMNSSLRTSGGIAKKCEEFR
jgi:hypothetical protein